MHRTAVPQHFLHADTTAIVVRTFFDTYRELGHGFLEAVYQGALAIALTDAGVAVRREPPVPVLFRGREVGLYRPDFVVVGCVIVELKAAKALGPADHDHVINYLRATTFRVGLLLNFGPRPTVRRFVHSAARAGAAAPA